ncbi:hypothetical protein HPULCUR_000119 [Helicostylum pulchrum]|uniref:UV radiation resistance-associated gene protein n=1 Tax=Helicostylum pulchrum TaxID=562976 RepID=A0ABP9XIY2_9FUNG
MTENQASFGPRQRSQSSISLGNSTTTVEDSSLMKGAYKKSQQLQLQGLLDAFITLHTGNEPEFYKSEMIPNTINPTFRSLATHFDWMDWYDAASSLLVVRLWTRHSIPESAGQHTEPVLGYQDQPTTNQDFQLLLEWQVDLNALSWIAKSANGIYTAPDTKTLLTSHSKRASVMELDQFLDNASISSVQSSKKRSYTYNNIMKLNTIKDCIFDTQRSSEEVRLNIQDILDQEDQSFRLTRELGHRKTQLMEMEAQVMQQKKTIQYKLERLRLEKQKIQERKSQINESIDRCCTNIEDLKESEHVLEKNIKMRQTIFHTLNRRKKELIADLFSIYPIEQSYDDSQQFRIRGIHLPNSIYEGQNDELIATALGFTAHLVSMLAFYLEIPLRYPTVPMGSRATITDVVSLISGSRDFPLYAKGVDRYRFEFGVFLLNKNIEQLMNAYGLIVMDLRHTLPNIHYFIQAILTTSVTSSPTSMSVLSISSYVNGARNNSEERPIRQDHNHLTLQPTHPPSPSISLHSITNHSPKSSINYPSAAFLNMPQPMAAPAILDTITTSSSRHS